MHDGEYGLGIDIGDGTITAAICRCDDEGSPAAQALPIGAAGPVAPAAVGVAADGSVRVDEPLPAEADAHHVVGHVMARVGTPTPLRIGDRWVAAAEVAGAIAARVRTVAEAHEGRRPALTVVAVPPSWGEYRLACLADGLQAADATPFRLVSSAVAATYHHVAEADLRAEARVAVYDLGASTLDTAVVGPTPDGALDHVAVPPAPIPWGGRDIDDALLGHVLDCLDGELPVGDLSRLQAVRRAAVAAKEALSRDTVTQLDAEASGIPLRVTRDELDELIDTPLQESLTAITNAIAGAGLQADDLDGVVLAGGGAHLPLVAERLSDVLGRPLIIDATPTLTTALGAARWAADALPGAPAGTTPADPGTGQAGTGDADASEGRLSGPHLARRNPLRRQAGGPVARPAPGRPGRTLLPPAGDRPGRGASRAVLVGGLFLSLVVLPPSLLTLLSNSTGSVGTAGVADAVEPQAPAAPADTGNPLPGAGTASTSALPTGESSPPPSPRSGRAAGRSTTQRSATGGTTTDAVAPITTADLAPPTETGAGQQSGTSAGESAGTPVISGEPGPGTTDPSPTTNPPPGPTTQPPPTATDGPPPEPGPEPPVNQPGTTADVPPATTPTEPAA